MKVIIQTGARVARPRSAVRLLLNQTILLLYNSLHRLITNSQGRIPPFFTRRCPLPDGSFRHLIYKMCTPQALNLASAPDFLLLQDDDKTICILSFTDVPLPLRQTNFPKSIEISRIKVLHWIKRIVPNYIKKEFTTYNSGINKYRKLSIHICVLPVKQLNEKRQIPPEQFQDLINKV